MLAIMAASESQGGYPHPIIDQSVASLPPVIIDAYRGMNQNIANERMLYGATVQQAHLQLSRQAIGATAHAALARSSSGEARSAIVLGAGGCFDIPIEEIITEFDTTTVVDVDTEQTERALSNFSPRLLGKVTLLKADISGTAARLSDAVGRACDEPTHADFIATATEGVRATLASNNDDHHPDLGGDYSFVCSQLLMTQLTSIPISYFRRKVQERYGVPLSMRPDLPDAPLAFALNDYNFKVQHSHIAHLSRLVSDRGTVHFADTVAEIGLDGRLLPMTNKGVLDGLEARFSTLHEPAGWQWQSTPDRSFYVMAYSLAPKQT